MESTGEVQPPEGDQHHGLNGTDVGAEAFVVARQSIKGTSVNGDQASTLAPQQGFPPAGSDQNLAASSVPDAFGDCSSNISLTSTKKETKKLCQQEATELRRRGEELDRRINTAKRNLEVARKRHAFMIEEAQESRIYHAKLSGEMGRVSRVKESLPPGQQSVLAELCRLLSAVDAAERAETAALDRNKTLEAGLRAELEDFDREGGVVRVNPSVSSGRGGEHGEGEAEGGHGGGGGVGGPQPRSPAEIMSRIEEAHAAAEVEREQLASQVAQLLGEAARQQWEAEGVPSREELLECLRRLEELDRHSVARAGEFQRCRAGLASLVLSKDFMAKEARVLDSVSGSLEGACRSKGSRQELLRQFEANTQGVEVSLERQRGLLKALRARKEGVEEIELAMEEERRRFLSGTRELEEACRRHDSIVAMLDRQQQPPPM